MLPVRLQAEMNGDPMVAEARRAREIADNIIKPETPHARVCRIRTNAARWARLETVERASNILGEYLLQKVSANLISPVDPEGGAIQESDDSGSNDETQMRFDLHVDTLEPGEIPIVKVLTEEGLHAARSSAGCESQPAWADRMSAVHNLVEHTYILSLPRQAKVAAATDTAVRLLSMGWPEDRLSLFIGADCKAKWGQGLIELAGQWHGSQPA